MKKKECDCCKKIIYKEEFYLANDGDLVCINCLIDKGDTDNLWYILLGIVMMIVLIILMTYIYLYRGIFMKSMKHYKNIIRCVNRSHLLIQNYFGCLKMNKRLPYNCHIIVVSTKE